MLHMGVSHQHGELRRRAESCLIAPRSPAVPAVWGTADVSTQKDMGSSVKIVSCPTDKWRSLRLIRVLWLMFDEEGDRLRGCFQHVFTPVSCVTPSAKQEVFFPLPLE